MAKLGSYYGLCPLIDNKSLLGVSEDATPGCVIVTLGKNMAIKYKLSDQKQIHSWSTKEKLSSPVIYNKKSNNYVAAFNQLFLRFWNEDEQNLEKLKKIKFPVSIHTILPCEEDPVIIFKNGQILTLSYALTIRKDVSQEDILDKSTIEDQICMKVNEICYVGMLIKSKKSYSYIWTIPKSETEHDTTKYSRKIELNRSRVKLNGHVVMVKENEPILFTLWSDGRLYSHSLNTEKPESFFCVIESLSRQQPVCLLALNSSYLAMYGADSDQEGASLQIFNIQFKLTQAKLQMKLFTSGSKLWLIGNSFLLTVGQNLAVVPFHLATEQLAALVGNHKLTSIADDDDIAIVTEVVVEKWANSDTTEQTIQALPDVAINSQILELSKEGWSEAAICEEIFPKLFEKQNTRAILNSINYFADIPEPIIIDLLSYAIKHILKDDTNSDIAMKGIKGQYGLLLDTILTIPYSDVLLLPNLRTSFKFDDVLILLQYICFLLSENGHELPLLNNTQSERKLIDWGSLLLDAHYQQLLLSKDGKIIENLKFFKALIDAYLLCLDDCKKVEPVLSQIKRGKKAMKLLNTASLKYSIEKLQLY